MRFNIPFITSILLILFGGLSIIGSFILLLFGGFTGFLSLFFPFIGSFAGFTLVIAILMFFIGIGKIVAGFWLFFFEKKGGFFGLLICMFDALLPVSLAYIFFGHLPYWIVIFNSIGFLINMIIIILILIGWSALR